MTPPSKTPLTLEMKEAQAKAKVTAHVLKSLVLLTDTPMGTESEHPASGVLLRLRNGRVVVMTAGHALPPRRPLNLHLADGRFFEDAVCRTATHPDPRVDVALMLPEPEIEAALGAFALDFESVESSASRSIVGPIVAAGFPMQFTEMVSLGEDRFEHRFAAIVRYTTDYNHDSRWLSYNWREGWPIDRGTPPAHPALEVAPGSSVRLKKPLWLSGGPVYRVTHKPFDELDPKVDCKLIGVSVEYVNQRELASPWWRWRAWIEGLQGQ